MTRLMIELENITFEKGYVNLKHPEIGSSSGTKEYFKKFKFEIDFKIDDIVKSNFIKKLEGVKGENPFVILIEENGKIISVSIMDTH